MQLIFYFYINDFFEFYRRILYIVMYVYNVYSVRNLREVNINTYTTYY